MTSKSAAASPPTSARSAALFLTGLFVFCIGWFGWWIETPYGAYEINPQYYEQSVRNFEQWGFDTLMGMPMCNFPVGAAEQCTPNLHHPPLPFWIDYALGSKEWQIRIDAAFFSFASAVMLFVLLRRRFGDLAAGYASALLVLSPMHGFFGSGSCESFVLWVGLCLLASFRAMTDAESAARRRLFAVLTALLAFTGPWTDWPFVFFCVALAFLAWPREKGQGSSIGLWFRRLLVPAIPAALGAAAMLWWRHHKQQAWTGASDTSNEFDNLFGTTVQERPSWSEWSSGMWKYFTDSYTQPLVFAAALGGLVLIWRSPRLGLGFLFAGFLYQVVFAAHALEHHYFQAFSAPFVCGGAGALLHLLLRRVGTIGPQARWIVLGLASVLALSVGLRTAQIVERTRTPFYIDVAEVLERATRADDEPDGPARYTVGTNVIHSPCYLSEPQVFPLPVTDPALLAQIASRGGPIGLRYLWLRPEGLGHPANDPKLVTLLEMFPTREVPELTGASIDLGASGKPLVIERALLVTLAEPE